MGELWRKWFRGTREEPHAKSDAQIRRERIGKYFVPSPDKEDEAAAIRWMKGGVVGAGVVGLSLLVVDLPGLAVVVFAIGVLVVLQGWQQLVGYRRNFAAAEPCASDGEMDTFLEKDLDRIASRALQQLGLDKEQLELTSEEADPLGSRGPARRLAEQDSGPLVVFGPVLEAAPRIVGQDGTWRFGAYDVMVICPTAHHLGIFECTLDTRTGVSRCEEIREYYYADVAMVSLISDVPVDLRQLEARDTKGRRLMTISRTVLHELQIVGASGDRSSIVAKITDSMIPGRHAMLQESGLDRVIATLRRRLRDKKGRAA